MTHPIHSAEAERAAFNEAYISYSAAEKRNEDCDWAWDHLPGYLWRKARAAAHVGANGAAGLSAEYRAVIEEAAGALESAAAHNRSKNRSVLAHSQQDRADRLRLGLAAGAPAETPKPDLHAAIMNIPCPANPPFPFSSGPVATDQLRAYKEGHRDARHAAAELAATIGAGEGKDAARLEFVLAQCAWVQWATHDDTFKRCQLWTQDEDENYIVLSGDDKSFATEREAIDAAMRSKTSPGEAG